jgi:hypothetical protein
MMAMVSAEAEVEKLRAAMASAEEAAERAKTAMAVLTVNSYIKVCL